MSRSLICFQTKSIAKLRHYVFVTKMLTSKKNWSPVELFLLKKFSSQQKSEKIIYFYLKKFGIKPTLYTTYYQLLIKKTNTFYLDWTLHL